MPIINRTETWRLESAMRSPIPQVTAVLLLLHVALGCCFHHSHAATVADRDDRQAVASHCCGGHRGHDTPASPQPVNGDGQDSRRSCEGEVCVFIMPEVAPDLSESAEAQPGWLKQADQDTCARGCLPNHTAAKSSQLTDARGMRAHLLLQVLLI